MNRSMVRRVGVLVAAGAVMSDAWGQVMCGTFGSPPPLNNIVTSLIEFQGETYVGGYFWGSAGNYVTRWNGTTYVPLAQQLQQGIVTKLAVYDHGSGPALYAGGGSFTLPGFPIPPTHNAVVKWNGQAWSGTGFPTQVGSSGVRDMEVYDDGQGPELYIVGGFGLRRYNGTSWASVPNVVSAAALAVFDDGGGPALYVGGHFPSIGGVPARSLAKYRQGVWAEVGGGLSMAVGPSTGFGDVNCLEVLDLGGGPRLFAGGGFNRAGTLPVHFVASWDGAAWAGYRFAGYPTFSYVADSAIRDFATLEVGDRTLLLAGAGYFVTGTEARGLMVWDGERWYSAGPSAPQQVYAILPQGDGSVLAGGHFPNWVAEWTPGSLCYPNCDCSSASPTLNVADFSCFLQRFAACDMGANCDMSTAQPVLNVADFTCYLQRFAAGCD